MSGRKIVEMLEHRFGHLTVIGISTRRNAKGQMYWLCRCDCGNTLSVRGDNLRLGNATKCSACAGRGRRSDFVEGGETL